MVVVPDRIHTAYHRGLYGAWYSVIHPSFGTASYSYLWQCLRHVETQFSSSGSQDDVDLWTAIYSMVEKELISRGMMNDDDG